MLLCRCRQHVLAQDTLPEGFVVTVVCFIVRPNMAVTLQRNGRAVNCHSGSRCNNTINAAAARMPPDNSKPPPRPWELSDTVPLSRGPHALPDDKAVGAQRSHFIVYPDHVVVIPAQAGTQIPI
jgi:hypothetical protein